ncbi:hypothetical protein [Salinarimonas sp.]|uniref:hypothetical protein n=1 Tax=Salinarimonas sp. TaxID=2766526 RepID=UPI0032D8F7A0
MQVDSGVPQSENLVYRGSKKHKLWRPDGGFGTICPAWTHQSIGGGFAGDPDRHPWRSTIAHQLLGVSLRDSRGRRYAAAKGIAFEAQISNDGTWHGYPIPWIDVPPAIQDALIDAGQATRRDLRRQARPDPRDRFRASTDDD